MTANLKSSIKVGDEVPNFTLPSLDGKPVSLTDFKGKRLAVFFWASW